MILSVNARQAMFCIFWMEFFKFYTVAYGKGDELLKLHVNVVFGSSRLELIASMTSHLKQ